MKSLSGSAAIWIAYNCHFLSLARVPQEITAGCQSCWRRAGWRTTQWQLQAAQLPQGEDLEAARSPVRGVKSHGSRAEEGSRWGTSTSLTSSVADHIFPSYLSNHSLCQLPTKAKLQDYRSPWALVDIQKEGTLLQLWREFLGQALRMGFLVIFYFFYSYNTIYFKRKRDLK